MNFDELLDSVDERRDTIAHGRSHFDENLYNVDERRERNANNKTRMAQKLSS